MPGGCQGGHGPRYSGKTIEIGRCQLRPRGHGGVAAIATALAKAQTELCNPEKAMVGTVYNNRSDSPQNFRYASLSSGPDRQKDLERPADRNRANHRHRSGQRNGQPDDHPAAHIGGMDLLGLAGLPVIRDIRAPPDGGCTDLRPALCALHNGGNCWGGRSRRAGLTSDQPKGEGAAEASSGSSVKQASNRARQFQTGTPSLPLVREKLGVDESASIRTQLIQEIETLLEDDLRPRAIGILKTKNRLSADDAKRVEDAFAARMALRAALPEDLTTDERAYTPTDPSRPQPPSASTAAVKPLRPRGRPRKVKPRPTNLLRLRFRRSQPTMTAGRLRHIFEPTLLPQKSTKVCLRSASRVGIVTRIISNSWHRNLVWFAGEVPLTPII
jgi:hypothetical protein